MKEEGLLQQRASEKRERGNTSLIKRPRNEDEWAKNEETNENCPLSPSLSLSLRLFFSSLLLSLSLSLSLAHTCTMHAPGKKDLGLTIIIRDQGSYSRED